MFADRCARSVNDARRSRHAQARCGEVSRSGRQLRLSMRPSSGMRGHRPGATLRPLIGSTRPALSIQRALARRFLRDAAAQLLCFGRKCPGRHTDDVQVDRDTPQVTGSSTRVRVRIAAMRFRVTGEKEAGPSDRVRLPTRRKPSKGQRAGGKAARARAVFGRQRHALRKPGEPQVRYRDATGPNPYGWRKPSKR